MKKKCPNCKRIKFHEEFNKNRKKKNGIGSWCKRCVADARLATYYKNPRKHRVYDRQRRVDHKTRMIEILVAYGCVDCGEKDPLVLHFDHVRGEKSGTVSRMVNARLGWAKIQAEIDKCEVRCANCHMRKTAARAGNWQRGNR